jgi:hypothetical protein
MGMCLSLRAESGSGLWPSIALAGVNNSGVPTSIGMNVGIKVPGADNTVSPTRVTTMCQQRCHKMSKADVNSQDSIVAINS